MTTTFRQPGATLTLIAPAGGVVINEGYLIGSLFVIAANGPVAATEEFQGMVGPAVFTMNKVSAQAWAAGDQIFWDNTGKEATNVGPADAYIGVANLAAINPSATAEVKLNGIGQAEPIQTADLADLAVTTAKLAADAVTSAKIADGTIVFADTAMFVSTEQTGTGAPQNIAHGLGATPAEVLVVPTDTSIATVGDYKATEGAHDATNVIVTVTLSKLFKVWAMA